eukprot:scaffold52107_cov37-Prasinocladus_malaysianus.AAC.2
MCSRHLFLSRSHVASFVHEILCGYSQTDKGIKPGDRQSFAMYWSHIGRQALGYLITTVPQS